MTRSDNISTSPNEQRGMGLETKFCQNLQVHDSIFSSKKGGASWYPPILTSSDNYLTTTRFYPEDVRPDSTGTIANCKVYDWPFYGQPIVIASTESSGTTLIQHQNNGNTVNDPAWPEPSRSLDGYVGTKLGLPATDTQEAYASLRPQILDRARNSWTKPLSAHGINDWIFEGFGVVRQLPYG